MDLLEAEEEVAGEGTKAIPIRFPVSSEILYSINALLYNSPTTIAQYWKGFEVV